MSLSAGDMVPDFSMAATNGQTVTPGQYREAPFVMFFFPKADTPGCTKEAVGFSEALPDFAKTGTAVLGVSKDPVAALEKFAQKYGLSYPLASDTTAVAEALGVWVEKSMYGKTYMGLDRATFLIGRDGRIAQVWRKVKVPGHVEAVAKAAATL